MSDIKDVLIIGGGGAGMTAALYAARANLKVSLIEKMTPGGQIFLTDIVENYPGFPEGITGPEISDRMLEQAKKYGTEVVYSEVSSISELPGRVFQATAAEKQYQARSIILALGAEFKKLGIPGETELTGRGVSYCATCDGAFFRNKEVMVIGGGDSAVQEAIFLTRFAAQVTIVHRRDKLRASPILADRAKSNPKIQFLWNSIPVKILGEKKVDGLEIENVLTQKREVRKADGVFIFIGHGPNSSLLKSFVQLDEAGYVMTNDCFETSRAGVFAAGEIRRGSTRQLVAACGEGCAAALEAQHYLENL